MAGIGCGGTVTLAAVGGIIEADAPEASYAKPMVVHVEYEGLCVRGILPDIRGYCVGAIQRYQVQAPQRQRFRYHLHGKVSSVVHVAGRLLQELLVILAGNGRKEIVSL